MVYAWFGYCMQKWRMARRRCESMPLCTKRGEERGSSQVFCWLGVRFRLRLFVSVWLGRGRLA